MQELELLQLLQGRLHRKCYTGVATQEFRQFPSDQIVSEPLQNQTSPILLFLSGGRQPAGSLRNVIYAMSDIPTSAEMRVLLVLRQPSAEWCGEMRNFFAAATVCGDRAFQTPKHVIECEFLLGTGKSLRYRAGPASKHVEKCKFGEDKRDMKVKRQ